jgi:hypothetical protein
MTFFGFFVKNLNVARIAVASLAAPTTFFILSNFFVWASGSGYHRPFTFSGLVQCMEDGLPFYPGSLLSTVCFSVLLFGGYYLMARTSQKQRVFEVSNVSEVSEV